MDTTALPDALRRALPLLTTEPAAAPLQDGYLDLLGAEEPQPSGPVQSLWESRAGTAVYEPVQAFARKVVARLRPPAERLHLPEGGTALDVGCGPGTVTAELGRDVGRRGLAIGVDVSRSMLRRAAEAHSGANVGFLRADVTDLPLRDASVDAVTCLMVLQLVHDQETALAECARVVAPGGRIAVLQPGYAGPGAGAVAAAAGLAGLRMPGHRAIAATLRAHGMTVVEAETTAPVARVLAEKPGPERA
ncbi:MULTISPECIES: class I SAM-dependent methyltransferase [Prauserella salsuginis group]|uniref:SAM-dependent methyltransferase n=2 Tax=Prauserella salsuginis group TaxID=2893672 RepID=A0A839XXA2_9PSEU|nr:MULTISPECIES: methyltransferase domain-containing protein [Prauserella salsuginis group]MBB3664405.1 SAM-dependent methyltransferase [Prauserella sediminis]